MERNLDRRVEVQVPIENRTLQQELLEAFEVTWRDDLFTWVLGTDRRWRRLQPVNNFSARASSNGWRCSGLGLSLRGEPVLLAPHECRVGNATDGIGIQKFMRR